MKTIVVVVFALFVASTTAFTPSSHQSNAVLSSSLKATTAELDGMIGVDIETGKKIVRD